MRIIEPKHLYRLKAKNKRFYPKKTLIIVGLISVMVMAIGFWRFNRTEQDKFASTQPNTTAPSQAAPSQPPAETKPEVKPKATKPRTLKVFSSDEFRNLYNTFAYPGTREVVDPPSISGNATADSRIRAIAVSRGYRLRSVPSVPLVVNGGFGMQEKIAGPWQELKAAAAKDGIVLNIVSAFRSIEDQRSIFLKRLRERGATIEQVAAGEADATVDYVLKTSSIPGYSRHHTGYTLDFKCNNEDFNFFASTKCFTWLSKNNYENAKKFGWIPSYPPGTSNQGPDPEAWEYVWVGFEAVSQP